MACVPECVDTVRSGDCGVIDVHFLDTTKKRFNLAIEITRFVVPNEYVQIIGLTRTLRETE